jgi:hypothetical protein
VPLDGYVVILTSPSDGWPGGMNGPGRFRRLGGIRRSDGNGRAESRRIYLVDTESGIAWWTSSKP